jgi:hypothetical protein
VTPFLVNTGIHTLPPINTLALYNKPSSYKNERKVNCSKEKGK